MFPQLSRWPGILVPRRPVQSFPWNRCLPLTSRHPPPHAAPSPPSHCPPAMGLVAVGSLSSLRGRLGDPVPTASPLPDSHLPPASHPVSGPGTYSLSSAPSTLIPTPHPVMASMPILSLPCPHSAPASHPVSWPPRLFLPILSLAWMPVPASHTHLHTPCSPGTSSGHLKLHRSFLSRGCPGDCFGIPSPISRVLSSDSSDVG